MIYYVSMDHGPVLSRTLHLIKDGGSRSWSESISHPSGRYEVRLIGINREAQKLSPAEEKLLTEIYEKYGSQSRWDLVEFTHSFSEWTNPNGSSIQVELPEILRALGESEDEMIRVCSELECLDAEQKAMRIP